MQPHGEGEFGRIAPGRSGINAAVEGWKADSALDRAFVLDETLPGTEAKFAAFSEALAAPVRAALERRGVQKLYAHQARAFEAVGEGRDIVVATPTASGKSLCYHL